MRHRPQGETRPQSNILCIIEDLFEVIKAHFLKAMAWIGPDPIH